MENVPWQEQVDTLLNDRRVDEALQIARSYLTEEDRGTEHLSSLLKRAALVQLHRNELGLAKELLLESHCSPDFILAYCPDLLTQPTDAGKSSPFYIEIFGSDQPSVIKERNQFLIEYLESYRRLSMESSSVIGLSLCLWTAFLYVLWLSVCLSSMSVYLSHACLSVCLSICCLFVICPPLSSACLPINLSVCLPIYLWLYVLSCLFVLPVCLSVLLPVCPSVSIFICLSVDCVPVLFICLYACLSSCLAADLCVCFSFLKP